MIDIPEYFRNTAIRIEDDVLITKNKPEVLSVNCPKTPRAIEKLINN